MEPSSLRGTSLASGIYDLATRTSNHHYRRERLSRAIRGIRERRLGDGISLSYNSFIFRAAASAVVNCAELAVIPVHSKLSASVTDIRKCVSLSLPCPFLSFSLPLSRFVCTWVRYIRHGERYFHVLPLRDAGTNTMRLRGRAGCRIPSRTPQWVEERRRQPVPTSKRRPLSAGKASPPVYVRSAADTAARRSAPSSALSACTFFLLGFFSPSLLFFSSTPFSAAQLRHVPLFWQDAPRSVHVPARLYLSFTFSFFLDRLSFCLGDARNN